MGRPEARLEAACEHAGVRAATALSLDALGFTHTRCVLSLYVLVASLVLQKAQAARRRHELQWRRPPRGESERVRSARELARRGDAASGQHVSVDRSGLRLVTVRGQNHGGLCALASCAKQDFFLHIREDKFHWKASAALFVFRVVQSTAGSHSWSLALVDLLGLGSLRRSLSCAARSRS